MFAFRCGGGAVIAALRPMPPTLKAALGLCASGAVAVGAGMAGVQPTLPGTVRTSLAVPFALAAVAQPARCALTQVLTLRAGAPAPAPWFTANAAVLGLPTTRLVRAISVPPAIGQVVPSGGSLGAQAWEAMVRRIARRYSVEWRLVMAIIASESGGDPRAVSPAGAIGLMQLMPDTADLLGVNPWDPEQNVEGAVRYLSTLLTTFGSLDLSLVAYNAGPGFAQRYREGSVELGAETRAFLQRVTESLGAPSRPES
jgi:soluble lytic murein transglycosylase-like protein